MSDDPWGDQSRDSADAYPDNREGPHDDLGTYDPGGEHPRSSAGIGMGVKILIGLLLFGGLAAVLCCGGFAYFASQSAITDSADVRAAADEIARVDLPDRFEPRMGLTYPPPAMSGWMPGKVTVTFFHDTRGTGVFKLARLTEAPGADAGQLRQFEQSLDQNPDVGLEGVDVTDSEDRVVRLASGQDATFNFASAKSRDDGTEYRQVSGRIAVGETDTVSLTFLGPEAEYDEAEVMAILESIEVE